MHLPPPVSLPTTTPAAWRRGVLLMAALVCATLLAWALEHLQHESVSPAWVPVALATAGCGFTLAALRPLHQLPLGMLTWDGQQWCWHAEAQTGAPAASDTRWTGMHTVLDLGSWMLLRPPAAAPVRWLAVQSGPSPGAWHLMRCAVYSSAPSTSARAPRPAVTMPPGKPTPSHER